MERFALPDGRMLDYDRWGSVRPPMVVLLGTRHSTAPDDYGDVVVLLKTLAYRDLIIPHDLATHPDARDRSAADLAVLIEETADGAAHVYARGDAVEVGLTLAARTPTRVRSLIVELAAEPFAEPVFDAAGLLEMFGRLTQPTLVLQGEWSFGMSEGESLLDRANRFGPHRGIGRVAFVTLPGLRSPARDAGEYWRWEDVGWIVRGFLELR